MTDIYYRLKFTVDLYVGLAVAALLRLALGSVR